MATVEIPDELIPDGYEIAEPRIRRAEKGEIYLENNFCNSVSVRQDDYPTVGSYIILKKIETHQWPEWLCKAFRWVAVDGDGGRVVGLKHKPSRNVGGYLYTGLTYLDGLDGFIDAGVLTLPKDGKKEWKLPVINDE